MSSPNHDQPTYPTDPDYPDLTAVKPADPGPRVLFLIQDDQLPSSRFRVKQFIPGFIGAGLDCTVVATRPTMRPSLERRLNPAGLIRGFRAMQHIPDHDIVFIQRPLMRSLSLVLERRVSKQRPTIFDMDDALFHNAWGLEGVQIKRIVRRVSHVIVGNHYLFNAVNAPEKTTIIPTVIDTRRYQVREDPDRPFTIGWTGLSSNLRELRIMLEPLRRALKETNGRLLIVADRCNESWLKDLPVEFRRWNPQTEVEALAEVHVGIMPLRNRLYNRGKCGFKLIQYMARGIPVMATPLGANRDIVRHGVDGWHARTEQQWADGLIALARDPALRQRMGRSGRARAQREYSIDAVIPQYVDLIRKVAAAD